MGLSSVLSTAITGLKASETTIDVAGNNVANANTIGFKESDAIFANQFLQTLSLGSAPTDGNGGTNPKQIGLGVQVAAITPNFTQGTLSISSNPSDLAIQGDGFFIVKGNTGEHLYTRNGKFQTNAQNELVTINGDRLLGFGVDDDFNIQRTTLTQINVPLGSAAVAKPTENVFLEGTLTPTGDLADTAQIIQSEVLGDSALARPDITAAGTGTGSPTAIAVSPTPIGTAAAVAAGGTLPVGTYRYRVAFADRAAVSLPDTESAFSADLGPLTVTPGNQSISLSNMPAPPATYDTRRVYRSSDNGATYQLISEVTNDAQTAFTDNGSFAAGANLDTAMLNGNYSYYVTFKATGGVESRPSPVLGPVNVVNGRVQLTNIPVDSSGTYGERRIYRNLSSDSGTFYLVDSIPNNAAGFNYTDRKSDAAISGAGATLLDFDGPRIQTNTLLTNVLQRKDSTYQNVFVLDPVTNTATLSFTGRKGDRVLGAKELTITPTTNVLDLMTFLEQSLGVQKTPGPDPLNPVPPSNTLLGTENPGGVITAQDAVNGILGGQIRMVGNNGVDNAIEIRLSSMTLTTSTGASQINLNFGAIQEAKGKSAVADFIAYDSLGIPMNVRVTAVLETRTDTTFSYRWFANSADNDPLPSAGVPITVGTGLITFDSEGKFLSTTNDVVSIDRRTGPSASPAEFQLDFTNLSGLAATNSSLAATRQDGFPPGKLTSFIVGEDGVIRGVFDNGTQRDLGQIRLARFANANGLEQRGENLYATGVNSGLAIEGDPNTQGIGSIIAGAVELSNTDIGSNLIDLILASTMYRGNARVITTAQQLFDELLNLRR